MSPLARPTARPLAPLTFALTFLLAGCGTFSVGARQEVEVSDNTSVSVSVGHVFRAFPDR